MKMMPKHTGKQYYFKKHNINSRFWNQIVIPAVLKRYNHKCARCYQKKKLDVHHTDYDNQSINNFIALCRSCHGKEHVRIKQ